MGMGKMSYKDVLLKNRIYKPFETLVKSLKCTKMQQNSL